MQEGRFNAIGLSSPGAVMSHPVLHLGGAITPQALRRARRYVDLLTNPPPPPHPFGVFLEEAGRLKTAAAAASPAVVSGNFPTTDDTHEGTASADTAKTVEAVKDAESPLLLELLRKAHGYSSGNAMYRMWVRNPQEYLTWMAQQIANLVLTRVMPVIHGEKYEEGLWSAQDKSITRRETVPFATNMSDRYDIHVRFLPSPSPSAQVNARISESFCAEIIVRDVEALRRLDEDTALLQAQYTSVAAEGQTVQSALAFWRSVKMEADVEEGEGPLSVDMSSTVVVLGRDSDLTAARRVGKSLTTGGTAVFMQPPAKRSRTATITGNPTATKFSRSGRQAWSRATLSEWPKAPVQSAAGLVAVFYLAFTGTLYTGVVCDLKDEGESHVIPEPCRTATDSAGGAIMKSTVETTVTPQQDVEPVFFLPCTASTSFVRGLLGL